MLQEEENLIFNLYLFNQIQIYIMRFFAAILLLAAFSSYAQNRIEIDKVWSGHQVGFSLLSDGDYQYVAYYNSERRMTVGQRKLNENKFNII